MLTLLYIYLDLQDINSLNWDLTISIDLQRLYGNGQYSGSKAWMWWWNVERDDEMEKLKLLEKHQTNWNSPTLVFQNKQSGMGIEAQNNNIFRALKMSQFDR